MNPKLKKTITALQISGGIYFFLAILLPWIYISKPELIFHSVRNPHAIHTIGNIAGVFFFFFCSGLGVFIQLVIHGLKKTKYWAWIAGLILTGIYIPSLFFILGLIGLLGLIDKSVIDDFQKARNQKISAPQ